MVLLGALGSAEAAERPGIGPYDRYRVEQPDLPGAEAGSDSASVLTYAPEGLPWTVEEAPSLDEGMPLPGDDAGTYDAVEGLEALGAAPWRQAGIDGAGARIAVFDSQFYNALAWADELGDVTTHDCQASRSCDLPIDSLHPTYSFEEGSHGVACAQVIHDIAPGAELHLVRVNGTTTLENAAAWAAREQIDVVSMSMSFFSSSFYDGDGLPSRLASRMASAGVLLVNSAGNYAEEHWDGQFYDADGDDDLDFPWGSSYLPMYYGAGDPTVLVSWDQYQSCGDTDFDVYVYDENGQLVGRSELNQPDGDSCSPVERVAVHASATAWYYLRIVRRAGDPLTHVAVYARGGYAWGHTPGSIADPGSSPSSFTVGAVRAVGYLQNGPESFSSLGPTQGGLAKPDIAGPDGLTTAVYGAYGFYGTSASTPAVAAAVTLVMQAEGLSARDAANRLAGNAQSDRRVTTEWDGALGAGRARLWSLEDVSGACATTGSPMNPWVFAPALLWWARQAKKRSRRPS